MGKTRLHTFLAVAAVGLATAGGVLLSSGCLSGGDDPAEPIPGSGGIDPADLYPPGPYGTTVGRRIKNYTFPGYARPERGIGEDKQVSLQLQDFYNPTGRGTYPADSQYDPGGPIPRALVIDVSAVWCGPCKAAAQNLLPEEYAHFKPLGAELILVLADSVNPGEAADFLNLDNWVSTFEPKYPNVIDPSYQMGALFDASAFPANFIIDTTDMSIVEIVAGVPQKGFWDKLEELLAKPLPSDDVNYPEGPYGTTVGSRIKNYKFPGYARPGRGIGEDKQGTVELKDFYNPTGKGIYPADSQYDPGGPMPRGLVIDVSAVWCGPCKAAAQNLLPEEYAHFKPLGAELLLVLADSVNPGEAADILNLDNWVTSFEPKYPNVIDPSYQMGALFDASAFPANFIIDTSDMSIIEIVAGVPQDGFWNKLEELLAKPLATE